MSKPEHMLLARQGAVAIARWREEHPGERLDFSGGTLSNHNLNRADVSEADFRGADLVGVRANQANLRKADLRDAVPLMGYLSGADLSGADLGNAVLRMADLSGARLVGANLTGVNLNIANLTGADLENAILVGVNLREAKLNGADLSGADLSRSDFNNADLTGADLTGANLGKITFYRTLLNGTVFKRATMFHTVFGDCDLSKAIGLDEVMHAGPSVLGTDTISRSAGHIPENFLRGIGVPEDMVVNYQRAVADSPDQFYTCFISYCSKDKVFTERLQADLRGRGVRCWEFPADARGGRWIAEATTGDELGNWIAEDVDRGIRYYDKLVVVCSGDSLATERVRDEIVHGIRKQEESGRWLFFPVAISDAPYDRRNRHVRGLRLGRHVMLDFRGWGNSQEYNAALDTLLHDLNRDQELTAGMAPLEQEEED